MNRLSFGIKTAPAEFNRVIDRILQGLNKTISYFDDILVHGRSKQECRKNIFACLERLCACDLHLNKNKCFYFQTKIEYLGHVIENNKISKSPSKVKAIIDMPQPKNITNLRRFLGMITYYSRFLPDVSTITYPLRRLLKKDKMLFWSAQCQAAFIKLKNEVASERVLIPFDTNLPVTLTTDASPVGIAAVLSHGINKVEHPIAFASRSLTDAEQNYSQLDREALAIVFGVDHFFDYLFGHKFTLITDNQPLTRIFHPKSKFPKKTSARLLRYASFLAGFDYVVSFKKGTENKLLTVCHEHLLPKEKESKQEFSSATNCFGKMELKIHYIIELDEGKSQKRHINQLQKVKLKRNKSPLTNLQYTTNRNQASHHQTLIRSNTLFYSLNQINRSIMTPTRHLIRNLNPCLIHPYADHNAQDDPRDILRTMSTQPEI
ncbi:K02A2.6-like [Cordylochernes scorpioides]|uniref:K02A2.6-like n=1 Tax=Cordylochernes scorpioides TaxID=51811 RepID=A0ABY6KX17_9ARAC|nr:K02A2.6-like [Cordylochernes scorpioides]